MCLRANADELEPWEWFLRFKLLWTNHISSWISEEVTHRNRAWSSGKFDLCLNWRVIFCESFKVFPIKLWTLKKISGMFIVSRPIRREMKPQKMTGKQQQGSVTTWYETTSWPFFFYKKSSMFPLDLSEKAIFWLQNQHQSLDSVCSN